jgi:hypothetical protein
MEWASAKGHVVIDFLSPSQIVYLAYCTFFEL